MIAAEHQGLSIEELRDLGCSPEQIAASIAELSGLSESSALAAVYATLHERDRKPGEELIEF